MTVDWGALQGAIDGDVVLPGSPSSEWVGKPVMARFAPCGRGRGALRDPADMAATLAVARGRRLPTAIRSGGHSPLAVTVAAWIQGRHH